MSLSFQSMSAPDGVAGNTQVDRDDKNSSSPLPTEPSRAMKPLLRPPSSARLPLSLPLSLVPPKLTGPTGSTGVMKGATWGGNPAPGIGIGIGIGANSDSASRPPLSATSVDLKQSMSSTHLLIPIEMSDKEKDRGRGRGYSSASVDGRRQNTEESSMSDSESNPRHSIFNSTSNGSSVYITPSKLTNGRDEIQDSGSGDGGGDTEREKEMEKEREMRRAGGDMSNSNDNEDEEMKAEKTATTPSKLARLKSPSRPPSIPISSPPLSPDSLDRRILLRRSVTDPSGLGLDGSRVLQAPSTLSPPGTKSPISPLPAGETAVSRRLHAAAAARKLAEENGGYSPLPPPRPLTVSPKDANL